MAGLNEETFSAGAAIQAEFTFTRPATGAGSDIDYADAAITLELYQSSSDESPTVTLSVGSGLTRGTNTAASQVVTMAITPAQVTTLLGSSAKRKISYAWTITPTGGHETRRSEGNGYTGEFTLIKESAAGR